MDFEKTFDQYTKVGSLGVQPAPSYNGGDSALLGLAFDKVFPYNHAANCNTIQGTFDSSAECHWHDCYPTDSAKYDIQQTVAIYIRWD